MNAPETEGSGPNIDLPDSVAEFSLGAVLVMLRKNLLLVGAVAAAVSLAATFYTLGQTKIYEASATVLFDPQPPRPLGDQVQTVVDTGQGYWSNKEYYKTQFWVIQSLRVTSDVVRSLGLNRDAAFLEKRPATANLSPREVPVEEAAAILQQRLTVEPIKDSRLAVIKYQDADAERARRVVASLVETYVNNNVGDMMESSNAAGDWLHSQLGSLKRDLEESEIRLHEYKKDKNILSLSMDDQVAMLRDEMKQLNDALTQARTRREQARARRDELLKIKADDPQNLPARELIESPTLQMLREAYVDATRNADGLLASGKGENHPDVKDALARKESTRSALLAEVANIQGAVERDLAAIDKEAGGISKLFDEAQARAFDLNVLEIEYNRLARSKDDNEKLYALVMQRSKESDLTRTLLFNNIRIVERPTTPKRPISPDVPLNIAGGLLAGLVMGLAAAVGRERLDRTVKTPGDLERLVGMSFLGLLPSMADGSAAAPRYGRRRRGAPQVEAAPDRKPELIAHDRPTSGIAEAARAIRTNILFMSPDRPYRTVLVTSAGPSEGKTTVACCIATVMAQAGKRVVLLDCDMRRPRLHRVFDQSKDVGVTTALMDLSTLDAVATETPVPNLWLVTTGPLPPNPAEILHSEAFGKLLSGLRERFDCVVIDSPPIVPVTDAAVLSTLVDGTVLVVRAFQTSKDLAHRAARALRDVGGHAIGTVLNAVDLSRHEYGYSNYYYYRRDGYAAEEETSSGPGPTA